MAKLAKFLQGVAGAAGGAVVNVEDVFSTYLYEGNSSTQTITNGIDLSGEGGLVWLKDREAANPHGLYDTERGGAKRLISSSTSAEITETGSNGVTFNSNGFTITGGANQSNGSAKDIASWTFRKAPKFFDVVTYTGDGTAGRTVSHNLGSVPGCIIVKRTSNTQNWKVYHRGMDATAPEDYSMQLDQTSARVDDNNIWHDTAPTSTVFTVGSQSRVNANGETYVAYLFAHNDGDGEFGPDADQDIIKCGSYTGNGSTDGPDIDLGFEPQWVMLKNATTGNSFTTWNMYDNMRGVVTGGNDARLFADQSQQEYSNLDTLRFNADGFSVEGSTSDQVNKSGDTYIYIAIRRGPMGIPESASEVFAIDTSVNASFPRFTSNFPVDFAISTTTNAGDPRAASSRLTSGKWMRTNGTNAESTNSAYVFDSNDGYFDSTLTNGLAWMWKRAPNYFDVVAYTGDSPGGVGVQTISHNLGVAPEMIWFKRRDSTGGWGVLVTALGTVESGGIEYGQGAYLNETSAFALSGWWGSPYVAPTATEFTVRGSTPNASGGDYIAYLFASLPGVSKVGSFSHTNGTDTNVDCGFSSGARFVLVKRTDSAQGWVIVDSARGIVAGADPYLFLNVTDAEQSFDLIDPLSSGFTAVGNGWSTGSYIFYAIA